MNITNEQLQELQRAISDQLYIRVEKWNLYLGDAGLSEALSLECVANLEQGASLAARKSLENVFVRLGGGDFKAPLIKLVSSAQIFALEEILEHYCI